MHYKNSHPKNQGIGSLESIADVATEHEARSIAAAVNQLLKVGRRQLEKVR